MLKTPIMGIYFADDYATMNMGNLGIWILMDEYLKMAIELARRLMPKNLLMATRLQKSSSWKVGWTSDSVSNILRAVATLCKANWFKIMVYNGNILYNLIMTIYYDTEIPRKSLNQVKPKWNWQSWDTLASVYLDTCGSPLCMKLVACLKYT